METERTELETILEKLRGTVAGFEARQSEAWSVEGPYVCKASGPWALGPAGTGVGLVLFEPSLAGVSKMTSEEAEGLAFRWNSAAPRQSHVEAIHYLEAISAAISETSSALATIEAFLSDLS